MGLLKPAERTIAHFKCGLYGFQGSGKTYVATNFAVGLHKLLTEQGQKPGAIAMLDTERGSDFVLAECERHGVPLVVHKSRAFKDSIAIVDECLEQGHGILIIDSVTHLWTELMDSFQKRHRLSFMGIHHWGKVKAEWRQLTDRVVNSDLHMILCGRAGHEYENREEVDEVSGKVKKDIVKVGKKFKAEGEFGYEPSIIFELERSHTDRKDKDGVPIETHYAYCKKDRNMNPETSLDGKRFELMKFEDIASHMNCLNIGGKSVGVDLETTSEGMFNDESRSRTEYAHKREVLIEEIKNELQLNFPGSTVENKTIRMKIAKELLGTTSEAALKRISLDKLNGARASLQVTMDMYKE